MSIPPRPKTRPITHHVPEHLADAFMQAADEFFAQARGGRTSGQRAAEVRAQDHDAGLDSLTYLLTVAEGDTNQAGTVARFLAGLYNGTDFPFDLTELRGLDADLFEHCLAVLRLDNQPKVKIHRYLPDGNERFQRLIADWNLSPIEPPPPEGARLQARYASYGNAPGYRDMSLYFRLEGDLERQAPIELCLSARDTAAVARDIVELHRHAWSNPERGPLDREPGEERPRWL
ncbi:DUF7673 family protein [Cupriavidus necator]